MIWRALWLFLAFTGFIGDAAAQQPRLTTQASLTLTGSFQLLLAGGSNGIVPVNPRSGCTIQNNGSHTMYVFFGGAAAPSVNTSSFQLAAQQSMNCLIGGQLVAIDNIWINGTSGDIAVYTVQ